MNRIKPTPLARRIRTSLITSLVVFCLPLIANAQAEVLTNLKKAGDNSGLGLKPLPETVGSLIKVGLSLLGMVFLALIVYAGFVWLLARGREDEIARAQKIIETSAIGLLIIFIAYAITKFIFAVVIGGTGAPT